MPAVEKSKEVPAKRRSPAPGDPEYAESLLHQMREASLAHAAQAEIEVPTIGDYLAATISPVESAWRYWSK